MKVSMSSERYGLTVSVSAQLQHEGSEHESVIPRFALKGGHRSAEALDELQEIVQKSMPEALLQADLTLQTAIEEGLLSRLRESSSDLSDKSVVGSEGIQIVPTPHSREQPAEKSENTATEIVVVHGPEGCGKSTNALRLLRHFKADEMLDGEFQPNAISGNKRTLVLSNEPVSQVLNKLSPRLIENCSVRLIHFSSAIRELS